jgi:hypothetical protein
MLNFALMLIAQTMLISLSSGCGVFETKRTCECSAIYTMGTNLTEKSIFDLSSIYDDCGQNLGCLQYQYDQCALNCLKRVRQILGGREDFLTKQGSNAVCELVVAPGEIVTANRRIRVYAFWKYAGCSEALGREIVVDDLCCNRKCECLVHGQKVANGGGLVAYKLQDLSGNVVQEHISYECSLNELNDCQTKCFDVVGNYFDRPDLKKPDLRRLNFNIFAKDKSSSSRVIFQFFNFYLIF